VRRGADIDRFLVRDTALHVCTEMITLRHTVPLPLLARSATPFFAAGIRGFETTYLQSAAAVCIFAGDRVRLGDEHPVAGPSDATKKVYPLSAWY
jgi:hypothetical protein